MPEIALGAGAAALLFTYLAVRWWWPCDNYGDVPGLHVVYQWFVVDAILAPAALYSFYRVGRATNKFLPLQFMARLGLASWFVLSMLFFTLMHIGGFVPSPSPPPPGVEESRLGCALVGLRPWIVLIGSLPLVVHALHWRLRPAQPFSNGDP